MNKNILVFLSFLFCAVCFTACGHGGENTAEEAVDSFSVAYFNWRFADAQPFSTIGSTRWLSFAASQVTQEDVDSLRNMRSGAEVEVDDIDYADDSTAEATVIVKNFLPMDSIAKRHGPLAKARFKLPLKLRNDRWLVNLTALPRMER